MITTVKPAARREQVLALLKDEPFLTIAEIARRLSISEITARRDVNAIASDSQVTRVRGGVFRVPDGEELPIGWRYHLCKNAKQAIAEKAAELVRDGDVIALDIGTTALYLAPLLAKRDVIVVTNNLRAADLLADGIARIAVLGGNVRPRERSIVGREVLRSLQPYRFSTFFMSVGGVSLRGFTDPNQEEILIKQAILDTSDRTFVLADHHKFGLSEGLVIADLKAATAIITDQETLPEDLVRFKDAGANIITAQGPLGPRHAVP